MYERFKIDSDAYHHRAQTGPCFICQIAPLPPDVPYRQQQIAAIRQDPLRIPDEAKTALAARIRCRLAKQG